VIHPETRQQRIVSFRVASALLSSSASRNREERDREGIEYDTFSLLSLLSSFRLPPRRRLPCHVGLLVVAVRA
jgi:hypothetical protein